MQAYLDVGVRGFGLGSALYRPGMSAEALFELLQFFVAAVQGVEFFSERFCQCRQLCRCCTR